MNYSEETEFEENLEQIERGRKYEAALDVLNEVIDKQRERIINQLETSEFKSDTDAIGLVMYLRVLRLTENLIKTEIEQGKIASDKINTEADNQD